MQSTPSLCFFLDDGTIIAYDLIQHQYYQVDSDSFQGLINLSTAGGLTNSYHKQQFDELGIHNLVLDIPWQGDPLSHVAHQSSRIYSHNTPVLSPEQFVAQYTQLSSKVTAVPEKEVPPGGTVTALPVPSLDCFDQVSLGDCFRNRKTSRNFIEASICLDHISNILYACFAPIHGTKREEFRELGLRELGFRRSSPSSTGLAGCEAILWANNITGLENGIYSYDESCHTLIQHPLKMTEDELIYGMLDQFWIKNLSAGIFIVNDMRRTWLKDMSARGYLASHQESGHLSQNILLCATALELHTWISGSFRDDFLNDKLGLPGYRFVSLFIGLGQGNNQAVSSQYMQTLQHIEAKV